LAFDYTKILYRRAGRNLGLTEAFGRVVMEVLA
jgi:hypothetical protein